MQGAKYVTVVQTDNIAASSLAADYAAALLSDQDKVAQLEGARAFTNEGKETYARVYATSGALRAGLECYRAFPNDDKANQR